MDSGILYPFTFLGWIFSSFIYQLLALFKFHHKSVFSKKNLNQTCLHRFLISFLELYLALEFPPFSHYNSTNFFLLDQSWFITKMKFGLTSHLVIKKKYSFTHSPQQFPLSPIHKHFKKIYINCLNFWNTIFLLSL